MYVEQANTASAWAGAAWHALAALRKQGICWPYPRSHVDAWDKLDCDNNLWIFWVDIGMYTATSYGKRKRCCLPTLFNCVLSLALLHLFIFVYLLNFCILWFSGLLLCNEVILQLNTWKIQTGGVLEGYQWAEEVITEFILVQTCSICLYIIYTLTQPTDSTGFKICKIF